MKLILANSPQEYLSTILTKWKNWEKHHKTLVKNIREVLAENERLKEENRILKEKCEKQKRLLNHVYSVFNESEVD